MGRLGGAHLERTALLTLVVVVEALVIAGLTFAFVSTTPQLTTQQPRGALTFKVIGVSEGDPEPYGRMPASGNGFLRIVAEVTNSLTGSVGLDNSTFTVWADGLSHDGVLAPPGELVVGAGKTESSPLFVELRLGSATEKIGMSAAGVTSNVTFVYRMASSPGVPQTIGINRQDTSEYWVFQVSSTSTSHALATTTFVMRWPSNFSVVNPPGQATLQSLKTESGGVHYIPVTGASQSDLRIADVITVSKSLYSPGMQVTIVNSSSVLWVGTL